MFNRSMIVYTNDCDANSNHSYLLIVMFSDADSNTIRKLRARAFDPYIFHRIWTSLAKDTNQSSWKTDSWFADQRYERIESKHQNDLQLVEIAIFICILMKKWGFKPTANILIFNSICLYLSLVISKFNDNSTGRKLWLSAFDPFKISAWAHHHKKIWTNRVGMLIRKIQTIEITIEIENH